MKEIKVISFEENEKAKDDDKINFYKNLRIITDNPIIRIENYFKKSKSSDSDKSNVAADDEWTKVDQVI